MRRLKIVIFSKNVGDCALSDLLIFFFFFLMVYKYYISIDSNIYEMRNIDEKHGKRWHLIFVELIITCNES